VTRLDCLEMLDVHPLNWCNTICVVVCSVCSLAKGRSLSPRWEHNGRLFLAGTDNKLFVLRSHLSLCPGASAPHQQRSRVQRAGQGRRK